MTGTLSVVEALALCVTGVLSLGDALWVTGTLSVAEAVALVTGALSVGDAL